MRTPDTPRLTRRRLLGAAVAGSAAVAGCTGDDSGDGSPEAPEGRLVIGPDDRAVFSDVEWYETVDWRSGGAAALETDGGVGLAPS